IMHRTGKPLLALAALILVAGIVISGSSTVRTAPPDEQNVRVINSAAEAVPTIAQGTTAVSGTVGAQQSGQWIVGISGIPSVVVGNDGESPVQIRDVDNPARH